MKIETQRLFLEKVNLEDDKFIFELFNTPSCIQFIGNKGITSLEKAKIHIQYVMLKSYAENGFGLYKMVLKNTQKIIGICGFVKRPELEHADIGFAILPDYEGKGYAFEAAKDTLAYGESKLKLKTILAITGEENIRSINLLERIGLKFKKKIPFGEKKEEVLLFSN